MDQLQILTLGNNNISDIPPLASLNNLKNLGLDSNNIKDISPLLELETLEYVSIVNNPLNSEADQVIEELRNREVEVDEQEKVI